MPVQTLISILPTPPQTTASDQTSMEEKSRRGIQSFEVGTQLLIELARHVKPMALKDLAKVTGMSTGKAHPYLVSFLKVGFVTQSFEELAPQEKKR